MTIRRELLDELLKDYERPQDILGEEGLLKELTKAVIERCLETELDTHLGYPKHARKGNATGNLRNGHSQKTLKGEQGHVDIDVPRDRQGTFEPQLIKKGQTRFEGFDEKILALYARGMTTRDIQAQLQELYGVEVSATLISNVTEAVMDEVRLWMLTIATRRGRRRALTGPLPVHEMCHWSIRYSVTKEKGKPMQEEKKEPLRSTPPPAPLKKEPLTNAPPPPKPRQVILDIIGL